MSEKIIKNKTQGKFFIQNSKTLILGLGKEAQDIINMNYKTNSNLNFMCLDLEKQVINTSEIKTIWYNNLKFQKTQCDFEEYKNILLNRTSKFNEVITKYENIIIVSCIGEKFGSETLFEIIKYIANLKIDHSIFVINPSDFDGKKACDLGVKTLEKLMKLTYSLGNNLFIYESSEVVKLNPNSINQAKSLADKKASEILSMILELKNDKQG